MKTILTAALICFALSASAQKQDLITEYEVYFPNEVEVVQFDDKKNSLWVFAESTITFEVHREEEPLHIIVATDSTRGNLLLMPSEKQVVAVKWEGVDLVLK